MAEQSMGLYTGQANRWHNTGPQMWIESGSATLYYDESTGAATLVASNVRTRLSSSSGSQYGYGAGWGVLVDGNVVTATGAGGIWYKPNNTNPRNRWFFCKQC